MGQIKNIKLHIVTDIKTTKIMTKVLGPLQTPEKDPPTITTTTSTTTNTSTLLDESDLLFCQQERLDQNSPELLAGTNSRGNRIHNLFIDGDAIETCIGHNC